MQEQATTSRRLDSRPYRAIRAVVAWCVRRRRTVRRADLRRACRQRRQLRVHPEAVLSDLEPSRDPGRPLAARRRILRRRPSARPSAWNSGCCRTPISPTSRPSSAKGAPRFYLPLDQQLKNQNFAQLFLMSKSIEARERVLDPRARHAGAGLPERPLQGRSAVQRSARRLAGAGARDGPRSRRGAPPRRRGGRGDARNAGASATCTTTGSSRCRA